MSAQSEIKLTKEGLKELEDELSNLVNVVREQVKEKIKEARSFGDLSENAEYDAARMLQGKTEARIKELEYIIKNAVIIDGKKSSKIGTGSKVTFEDVKTKEVREFFIVGSMEADPKANKISDESPIGKALIGHKAKEEITVETPNGLKKFLITKVK